MFNAFFLTLFLLCSNVFAGGAKTVWVNAYTKSNGTYVSGHYRSPPTGTSAGVSLYTPVVAPVYLPSSYPVNKIENSYCYDVKVWINGILLRNDGYLEAGRGSTISGDCFHSNYNSPDRTQNKSLTEYAEESAAESGILHASNAVQSYYFKKGLKASQVLEKTSNIFTQENCFATVLSTQQTASMGGVSVVTGVEYRTIEQCAISDVSNK